jgi:hypothetical protein
VKATMRSLHLPVKTIFRIRGDFFGTACRCRDRSRIVDEW